MPTTATTTTATTAGTTQAPRNEWVYIGTTPEYFPCRRWGGCPGAHFSTFRECEDFIRAYAAEHGLTAPRSCELKARRDYRVEYCSTYVSRRIEN